MGFILIQKILKASEWIEKTTITLNFTLISMKNKMYTQEQDSSLLGILHGILDESELHKNLLTDEQLSQGNLLHIMLFTSGRISYAEYKQLKPTKQPKLVFDDPNFDVIPFSANLL